MESISNERQLNGDGGDDSEHDGVAQDVSSSGPEKKQRVHATQTAQKDEGPACQSCRRKKAKCSRRQPCSFCEKHDIDCVYEDTRSRPGMRSGAIEHLHRRINTLEKMFLGQGVLWQQVACCLQAAAADESQTSSLNGRRSTQTDMLHAGKSLQEWTAKLRSTLLSMGEDSTRDDSDAFEPPSKRQKKDPSTATNETSSSQPTTNTVSHTICGVATPSIDLPEDLQSALVELYFARLHPWIPMLHVRQFRQKLADPVQRRRLVNVLYAITSLCIRFSDDPRLGADRAARAELARMCRDTVIVQSMQSFSVENLQALIICAFDTISSGRSPSAWSIVGSMTRTVEQLQLSVEHEDQRGPQDASLPILRRIAFLPPARDWVELEERRRVFWNVFLMDRFCSVATGWNLSLTSADVRRRLPCEGSLWEEGRIEVPTPYFGAEDETDQTSLGGFAYCVEATESLSLVTSFFLQHALDATSPQNVQMWLLRFKQLDLRLVRWKLCLPARWRDASARNADNNLDPNLVAAHITHNTAVVLLHQGIAYPAKDPGGKEQRSPSPSSAETCLRAATEVAAIAANTLTETDLLTSPQIAFCLFVCGRMVLAHALYYRIPLPAAFDSMRDSLWEIARRWRGVDAGADWRAEDSVPDNLAAKFAARLVHAKQMGAPPDIRQAAYSEDAGLLYPSTSPMSSSATPAASGASIALASYPQAFRTSSVQGTVGVGGNPQSESPDSMSLAFPPLPLAFQGSNRAGATDSMMQAAPDFDLTGALPDTGAAMQDYMSSLGMTGESTVNKNLMDDLNAFWDYSFLPDERVSIYSLPNV